MPAKRIIENWRVEVTPQEPWVGGVKADGWRQLCEELRLAIRRHVDGIGSCNVECDERLVCEHCGREWTEGRNAPHNGGCCDADAANMPEEEPCDSQTTPT